ncbi:MAG: 30S ribosomal protein S19e [Candidatus Micrarchaeota archaeon]
MSFKDVSHDVVISSVSKELKKNEAIKEPDWLAMVKTGMQSERLPSEPDFWFKRAAALLLTIANHGPVGVERLRNKYGGRKRHGVNRHHHKKAGGKNIRLLLQQLETAGLVKKEKTGRVITPKGVSLLDKAGK